MAKERIVLTDRIKPTLALVRAGMEALPAVILGHGERTSRRFIEFFTASIRNRNTRTSYARAVKQVFDWCDAHHLDLDDIEPIAISAYIELLSTEMAKPSVKQRLAAIRQLFDYLVTGGILPSNPAGSVRGPKYVTTRGKTPVLSGDEMRQLLESIDTSDLIGLRDRALIGVMGYTFARVSAVGTLRVEDCFQQGRRSWLRLHEKGGKRHEVPCHHSLDDYLNDWIAAAGIGEDKKGRCSEVSKKGAKLTENALTRSDVLYMIKRRAKAAGLPYSTCCHTFRATGITADMLNGGTLEHAQQIAAHQSPRTTKVYDRTKDEISLDEVERIQF
jgi:integrase/recombinase XerD